MPDFWQCLTEKSYLLESGTGLLEVIARLIADLFFATYRTTMAAFLFAYSDRKMFT
jgi:hypothetical protein